MNIALTGNKEGQKIYEKGRENNPHQAKVVFGSGYILEYDMVILGVREPREDYILRSGNINLNTLTKM